MTRFKKCDYDRGEKCDTPIKRPFKMASITMPGLGKEARHGGGRLVWKLCDYHYTLMKEQENKIGDIDLFTGKWQDPSKHQDPDDNPAIATLKS